MAKLIRLLFLCIKVVQDRSEMGMGKVMIVSCDWLRHEEAWGDTVDKEWNGVLEERCFSKCGSQIRRIAITWQLAQNTICLGSYPRPIETKFGHGSSNLWIYKNLYIFNVSILLSLDIGIYLWYHHHNQGTKHIYYLYN